jgi:hypothetical protein
LCIVFKVTLNYMGLTSSLEIKANFYDAVFVCDKFREISLSLLIESISTKSII